MSNVFFTSLDGQVWINKAHLKDVIRSEAKAVYNRSSLQRFADILIAYLDTLYYNCLLYTSPSPRD